MYKTKFREGKHVTQIKPCQINREKLKQEYPWYFKFFCQSVINLYRALAFSVATL